MTLCGNSRSDGQRKVKRCASSRVRGGPHTPTMRFQNGTSDGQSQACALRLGSKKCVEDLICSFGGQTRAMIAYRDQQLTIFTQLRLDAKFAAVLSHRFDA